MTAVGDCRWRLPLLGSTVGEYHRWLPLWLLTVDTDGGSRCWYVQLGTSVGEYRWWLATGGGHRTVVPTVGEQHCRIPLVVSTVGEYRWRLPLVASTDGGYCCWWLPLG